MAVVWAWSRSRSGDFGPFTAAHAAAASYPILGGERKIYGTLAAVVRCPDGAEDGRMPVPPQSAD